MAQLTFTLDPGTFSGDEGFGWRFASLLTTLFGVLVVASLIGVISAVFDDLITQLRKGSPPVIENGHTVILGWNSKVFTIVSELVIANESERGPSSWSSRIATASTWKRRSARRWAGRATPRWCAAAETRSTKTNSCARTPSLRDRSSC